VIFVTVGTQLAFPRLVEAMDSLAPDLDEEIVVQCGPVKGVWNNIVAVQSMAPDEFSENFAAARVIVAHAGIGTILSAKNAHKPLIIVPRQFKFGEHRNDHQMATARYAQKLAGVHVAWETDELMGLLLNPDLEPAHVDPGPSHAALVNRLRDFIDQ